MMNVKFLRLSLVVSLGIGILLASFVDADINDKPAGAAKGIKLTKHNLSNWGPGTVKATDETQVCIFCHAPHNADSAVVPLWGHKDNEDTGFTMASSFYVKLGASGVDDRPTSTSRKCLSCHDGTVGIGRLANGQVINVTGGGGTDSEGYNALASGNYGYIGKDLRSGHVISFKYADVPTPGPAGLKIWSNISTHNQKSMFDRDGKMQCHSCHDPHTDWCTEIDDATPGTVGRDPLWRKKCNSSGKNSSVCEVCHLTTFGGYTQGPPW